MGRGARTRWLAPAAIVLVLAASPAAAGLFGKGKARDVEVPPDTDTSEAKAEATPAPALADAGPLWDVPLPLLLGELPAGLANASAQGCAACHWDASETWAASAHARPPSEALLTAAADANSPACLTCHLPLQRQHRDRVAYDGGDPEAPHTAPNPGFDATLATEGVTCAACHVRDGHVVGTDGGAAAPHASRWSAQLQGPQACATCHQLTWPGADRPLYDTVGEWERSAYATAGIGCQDCHLRPGPDGGAVSHDVGLPPARAVSLLVDLPPGALVRGGDPQQATITLQNTGAGHAFPTGSPFAGVRLRISVEGPGRSERQTYGDPVLVDLVRTLEEATPWRTTRDTRLQAGAQGAWTVPIQLDVDAPRGDYALRTTLTRLRAGEPVGEPFLVREIPLRIE